MRWESSEVALRRWGFVGAMFVAGPLLLVPPVFVAWVCIGAVAFMFVRRTLPSLSLRGPVVMLLGVAIVVATAILNGELLTYRTAIALSAGCGLLYMGWVLSMTDGSECIASRSFVAMWQAAWRWVIVGVLGMAAASLLGAATDSDSGSLLAMVLWLASMWGAGAIIGTRSRIMAWELGSRVLGLQPNDPRRWMRLLAWCLAPTPPRRTSQHWLPPMQET